MRAKLIFLTLVTMFVAASVAAPRHPEVGASNAQIEVTTLMPAMGTRTAIGDLWLASLLADESETAQRENYKSPISDSEAIEMALQKGEELKAARETQTASGSTSNVDAVTETDQPVAAAAALATDTATVTEVSLSAESEAAEGGWTVTGDRVNLRAGPGTQHGVVGVAGSGETVEALSGIGTDWIEIRRADGSEVWIFAKFVAPTGT